MAPRRKNSKNLRSEQRRLTIRGIRRDPPDIHKISKALIGLAMAEAERQAQAEKEAQGDAPAATSSDETKSGGHHDGQ